MLFKILSLLTVTSALIHDCSGGNSYFNIKRLDFWPDPPTINKNSTLSFTYRVPQPGYIGGTSTYSALYKGVYYNHTVEDICKSIACPIHPGFYNSSWSYMFPFLNGPLIARIVWKSLSGSILLCAEIKTSV